MKNNRIFRAWNSLDKLEANTYWQPDQIDVWLALLAGVCIGAFLGVAV